MSRARAIIAAALVALAAALPGAAAAAGPAKPVPTYVPQAEVDRIAAWTSATLRAPVPTKRLTTEVDPWVAEWAAANGYEWDAYVLDDDVVHVRPRLVGGLARRTCESLAILLHELLHRPDAFVSREVEEGTTEALRVDLYPAAARALGCRVDWQTMQDAMYPDEVSNIVAASAFATGSRNGRTRAARLWRRQLWAASADGRRDMLAAAAAARDSRGGAR